MGNLESNKSNKNRVFVLRRGCFERSFRKPLRDGCKALNIFKVGGGGLLMSFMLKLQSLYY